MNKYIGSHIKAVLFDHDDTLVGTISAKWAQHKYVAQKYYNKTLTDGEIAKHWGKPLQELVGLLYQTADTETALAHNVKHHESFPKELFTGTLPVLEHLKKSGIKIGLITATIRFSFEHDLQLHNIPKHLFDYTQTAEDTAHHKPDPRVFDPVLGWLATQSILPGEVIYIGDGLHDMKAALGSGFSFLGVETGLVTAEQFKTEGVQSIPNIASLFDIKA